MNYLHSMCTLDRARERTLIQNFQRVGKEHTLNDEDVVQIIKKH